MEEYMKNFLDINIGKWISIIILLALAVLFHILAYISLKTKARKLAAWFKNKKLINLFIYKSFFYIIYNNLIIYI